MMMILINTSNQTIKNQLVMKTFKVFLYHLHLNSDYLFKQIVNHHFLRPNRKENKRKIILKLNFPSFVLKDQLLIFQEKFEYSEPFLCNLFKIPLISYQIIQIHSSDANVSLRVYLDFQVTKLEKIYWIIHQ